MSRLLFFLIFVGGPPTSAVLAEYDSSLLQVVARGIRANQEVLGGVSFEMQINQEVSDLTPLPKTIALPGGGAICVEPSGPSSYTLSGVINGAAHRCTQISSSDIGVQEFEFAFDGQLWKHLDPSRSLGQIRRNQQMPSLRFLNPMCVATPDVRWDLMSLLESGTAASVKQDESGVVLVEFDAPSRQPLVIDFSPRYEFLPVRSRLLSPAREVVIDTEISYQRIEARKAWFLDQAVSRSIAIELTGRGRVDDGGKVDASRSLNSITRMVVTHVSLVPFEDVESRLALDFPPSFRVVDHTADRVRTVGLKVDDGLKVGEPNSVNWLRGFLVWTALALLSAALLRVITRRRFRSE